MLRFGAFLDGVQVGGTLFPADVSSFNDTDVDLGKLAAGSYAIAIARIDRCRRASRVGYSGQSSCRLHVRPLIVDSLAISRLERRRRLPLPT